MVNNRTPRAGNTPDPAAVKNFVDGAVDEDSRSADPNAPRKFNSLTIPFNQYEWEMLEEGCEQARQSKSSLLREAMIEYVTARRGDDSN